MKIYPRASWGARKPKRSPYPTTVRELYLHHSVGSGQRDKDGDGDKGDDYMFDMQGFHMNSRGWNDVAYNHGHDPDSRNFYEGRGFGVTPGSQHGHNTGTHSLVVMGDFRKRKVTAQLVEDIASFYFEAQSAGVLPRVPVRGHRDAPGQSTTCPGTNLHAALPAINKRIDELHEGDQDVRPSEWNDADRRVVRDIVLEGGLGAEFGGPVGSPNRKTTSEHIIDIKALIGGLDAEGVSEAELQEQVDRLIAVIPDRVRLALKAAL